MSNHNFDLNKVDIRCTTHDESDWIPTQHGRFFAGVLFEHPSLFRGLEVLELGAGLGLHTILLARGGAKSVTATEYDAPLLESTKRNVEAHNCQDRVSYLQADWLNLDGQFDLVVANPPFCLSGKTNRRYFIDDLILNAHKRLKPSGSILFVQSSMADIAKSKSMLDENGFDVDIVASCQGPFRDYYFTTPGFMEEASRVADGYIKQADEFIETLVVIHAKLRPLEHSP